MSEINVISRTQIINVEPTSSAVSIINAGPAGPGGAIGSATGSVILRGTTPPLPSDGAVGNYWIDGTADVVYGPKGITTPVWPVAFYGAQAPPALLGEERVTLPIPFSNILLPVNIDIPVVTRLRVEAHIQVAVQAGAVYAFECSLDGITVGRFTYPVTGNFFVGGALLIPNVAAGQHTLSIFPNRVGGSGNCSFTINAQYPAYFSVYKDRK